MLCKQYMNKYKIIKIKISKIIHSGWYLGKLLGSLMKVGLQLMKSVLTPLSRSVIPLIPLRLTVAGSADEGTYKKNCWFGNNNTDNCNKKINDITEIVKSLEGSGLFKTYVSKSIKYEAKVQMSGFLGILGARLLGHLLIVM